MKRRDFLKITMGAMGISAVQTMFVGVDMAKPGSDKSILIKYPGKGTEGMVSPPKTASEIQVIYNQMTREMVNNAKMATSPRWSAPTPEIWSNPLKGKASG